MKYSQKRRIRERKSWIQKHKKEDYIKEVFKIKKIPPNPRFSKLQKEILKFLKEINERKRKNLFTSGIIKYFIKKGYKRSSIYRSLRNLEIKRKGRVFSFFLNFIILSYLLQNNLTSNIPFS